MYSVVVASPSALIKQCESGLLLPLFIKSIWSLDVVLVLLMRLANHWIFHSEEGVQYLRVPVRAIAIGSNKRSCTNYLSSRMNEW